jgi:hypothetical protein
MSVELMLAHDEEVGDGAGMADFGTGASDGAAGGAAVPSFRSASVHTLETLHEDSELVDVSGAPPRVGVMMPPTRKSKLHPSVGEPALKRMSLSMDDEDLAGDSTPVFTPTDQPVIGNWHRG